MLDYAANGVRYWPVERLRADLAARLGGQVEADSAVTGLLGRAGAAASVEVFWGQVEANLSAGRLRLLIVADVIPETLRRIIEFLNEQMTQCEVLGIEIRQYAASGHRVFTPTVIGQTSESRRAKRRTADDRTFDELLAAASVATRDVERRLDALALLNGWEVTTSRTGRQYRLPNHWALLYLFPSDGGGSLQFALSSVFDAGLDDEARALLEELSSIAGRQLTPRQPWARVEPFHEHWEQFAGGWLPKYSAAVDRAATLLTAG